MAEDPFTGTTLYALAEDTSGCFGKQPGVGDAQLSIAQVEPELDEGSGVDVVFLEGVAAEVFDLELAGE